MTLPAVIELPARGTPPRAGRSDRGPVSPYDFRRPTKISRDHVRALQLAFETMARQCTTLLTSGLRQVCTVEIGEVSQRSYDDYVAGLSSPSITVPLGLAPVAGTGTLHFSLPVALAAIDHMLGGPGGRQPNRTLTDIELPLLRVLLDQLVGVLRYSLEPIVALDLALGAVEYNPQFVQAAGAADAVIVGEFTLRIGEIHSPMLISLPLASMLPSLEALRPREAAPDAGLAGSGVRDERIGEVPVDVAARFEPLLISPDRILSLAVGDVLSLDHRVGAPLTLHAGDTPYARAVSGRAGTRLAVLVVDGPATR